MIYLLCFACTRRSTCMAWMHALMDESMDALMNAHRWMHALMDAWMHQHACMHPTHTHIHYTYILHSGVWTLDHCESPMSIVQCFEHRILGNQLYPMYAFRIDPHETSITKWVHLFVALGPLKKKLGSVVGTNYPLFHYGTLRCCFETHI